MKSPIIVRVFCDRTKVLDPSKELSIDTAWRGLIRYLETHFDENSLNEVTSGIRFFLLPSDAIFAILRSAPSLPPEIKIAVFNLASPESQFVIQNTDKDIFDPEAYTISTL